MMKLKTLLIAVAVLAALPQNVDAAKIRGRVTSNRKPVAGVAVSDGRGVVLTNARGRYVISSEKADSIVFISTPSGYVAEAIDAIRPGFWQLLTKPAGKNERHNFKLVPEDQSSYSALFITDMHFANDPERNDLEKYNTIVKPLVDAQYAEASSRGPVYTFNMGDFSHDRYWYDFGLNEAGAEEFLASTGYPTFVYSVSGNHDNDGAIAQLGEANDFESAWCYRHTWGPAYYSVNIGGDHWVMLDNVIYVNDGKPDAKHKNINGSRNYRCRLTDSQLEWLKADLEYVDPAARVFVVCHVPLMNDASKTERIDQDQLEVLDAIFSKFDKVTAFSGHTHRRINPDCSPCPRFVQYICPAVSGNMWKQPEGYPCIGSDGSDNGITVLDCSADIPVPQYITAAHGPKTMRVYDMNAVGEFFRNDPQCQILHKICPDRLWYGAKEYANMIFVNYWDLKPGDTVEVLENGKALDVEKINIEDPLFTITYVTPDLGPDSKFSKSLNKPMKNPHLFCAKAHAAKTPVVVRVRNAAGEAVCEEEVVRPKAFGKDAE